MALGLLLLLGGCRTAEDGSDAAVTDAARGDGDAAAPEPCSPYAPRASAPQVFVGPDGLAERLAGLIDGADDTVDVAIYQIDARPILDALERAAEREVEVRVLYDPAQDTNDAPIARLEQAGIDVHPASRMYEHYHPKLLVVDDRAAVVTSANLNRYSMQSERNHGVVLRNEHDLADLADLYELDWSDGMEPAELRCTRLVLSPNNSRRRIEALLRRAENELRLQQLSLTDDGIRETLAERADAGLRVRVILADPAWIESNADSARWLRDAGIEVRFLRVPENHAKLILADRRAAFVGSENLSWTSLEKNREVGVVLTHDEPLDRLVGAFADDWERAGGE